MEEKTTVYPRPTSLMYKQAKVMDSDDEDEEMGISVAPLTHVYPKKNDLLDLRELEMSSVANSEKARKIARGFTINKMNMRDVRTGKVMWESHESWGPEMFEEEMIAEVPKEILKCEAVSREIDFTSQNEMKNFRLEQRIFLGVRPLEEWSFKFGYVIPGSTNTWQQVIQSAGEDEMIDPNLVSSREHLADYLL